MVTGENDNTKHPVDHVREFMIASGVNPDELDEAEICRWRALCDASESNAARDE